MKSIKEHIMFIFPLVAMLMGIEFILVFNRVTKNIEEKLKSNYSILIVSKKPLSNSWPKKISPYISSIKIMNKAQIAKEVTAGMENSAVAAIMKDLPYFYKVYLNQYLSIDEIKKIKKRILSDNQITRVEIFGESYHTKYSLFRFIKFLLNLFVGILFIISIFLVIKQMEVWQLAHRERMRIMEIFGAPMMLRSGVLFKMASIDALIATLINMALFLYIQFKIVPNLDISYLKNNSVTLFSIGDFFLLLLIALVIVFFSVLFVAIKSQEVPEG